MLKRIYQHRHHRQRQDGKPEVSAAAAAASNHVHHHRRTSNVKSRFRDYEVYFKLLQTLLTFSFFCPKPLLQNLKVIVYYTKGRRKMKYKLSGKINSLNNNKTIRKKKRTDFKR